MRIQIAAQRRRRVDVPIPDPHREVESHTALVVPDRAENVASAHTITGGYEPLG